MKSTTFCASTIYSCYTDALATDYIDLYKSLKKADKATRTLEGCIEILSRFWDKYKTSYIPVVKACGACLPSAYAWADDKGIKPSAVKSMWLSMSNGNVPSIFKNDDGKVCIAKIVKVVNEEETIKGRDGKDVHPYVLDENGNVVTENKLI